MRNEKNIFFLDKDFAFKKNISTFAIAQKKRPFKEKDWATKKSRLVTWVSG